MRVFAIPVTRTQWALHCHPINAVPTRMTQWALKASDRWSKWAVYPRDTWRGKIYAYGERLMDRIDFKEYFLKEIPTKSEGAMVSRVDIVAPALLNEPEIIARLRSLAQRQEPYHGRWMKYCCYMLPISSLFTLVPVIPNFPFFYNLFRVYSHYKARHGAQHLLHLLDRNAYQVTFDPELNSWYQGAMGQRLDSPDSRTLPGSECADSRGPDYSSTSRSPAESDLDQSTIDCGDPLLEEQPLITDNDIARMAAHFQLPLFESTIRRARHQIVAGLSKPAPRQ
ncbi:hypothetical protein H4R20_006804 [Coemansia guatemalensis]|uniref:Mitochondrial K+-H+ exchange-related-domain-containing protein n=1 Tax=Coemansia guatemalensis TaxID=2761395 RepID=A0A9W8HRK4_9FUNG|nr:hypothetical protein H4R20_006804 [Coemansia guatemalensis]